jgi:anti-sigma factor RsiW
MMDEKLREDLVAYLDGEVDAGERARIERLVRDDPEAAAELESFRRVDALLDAYPAPGRDVDLTGRVVTRARRAGRMIRIRIAAAVAAVLLVLAVLPFALRSREPVTPTTTGPEELAIENLHALEYLALLEAEGADADALLQDADLLVSLSAAEVEVD